MNVIVITGGSRGIGAAAAIEVAKRGMGVILTYNTNAAAADRVIATIAAAGGKAVALPLDVGDADSFGAFKDAVIEALATTWDSTTLHGLVNNAGYGLFNPIETVTAAQFDGLLNVHLKGPFSRCTAACSWSKRPP